MVRARHALSFAVSLLVLSLLPQASALAQAGSAGHAFLKLGVTARGIAMADAMTAAATGVPATYYNPAGLVGETSSSIAFMHREWIQDTRTEFLGANLLLDEDRALGFSLGATSIGDIEIRTRPGPAEGTFTARSVVLGASYAQNLMSGLRAGVTVKMLYEKIYVDEAKGFAFDAGVQMTGLAEGLILGVALQHAGSAEDFRSTSSTLPTTLRAGGAYTMALDAAETRVTLALDGVSILAEKHGYAATGAEVTFRDMFFVRGGYQIGTDSRGLSLGGGVRYGILDFDYAYNRMGNDLGSGHTISLQILI